MQVAVRFAEKVWRGGSWEPVACSGNRGTGKGCVVLREWLGESQSRFPGDN